jgi:CheY-like chemotaxis protein
MMTSPRVLSKADKTMPLTDAKTILLLEDESDVMEFLGHMLKEYSVIEAPTAEHALRLFTQHGRHVDLLVADVTLPKSSGIQVAQGFTPMFPSGGSRQQHGGGSSTVCLASGSSRENRLQWRPDSTGVTAYYPPSRNNVTPSVLSHRSGMGQTEKATPLSAAKRGQNATTTAKDGRIECQRRTRLQVLAGEMLS